MLGATVLPQVLVTVRAMALHPLELAMVLAWVIPLVTLLLPPLQALASPMAPPVLMIPISPTSSILGKYPFFFLLYVANIQAVSTLTWTALRPTEATRPAGKIRNLAVNRVHLLRCPGSDSDGRRSSIDANTRLMKAQLEMTEIARKYPNDSLAHSNTHDMKADLQKYGNGVDGTISD
jgi:hypothetical protein